MKEKHFSEVDGGRPVCSNTPDTTTDKSQVTCSKCLVKMGRKQSPRGWRKSRARRIAAGIQRSVVGLLFGDRR